MRQSKAPGRKALAKMRAFPKTNEIHYLHNSERNSERPRNIFEMPKHFAMPSVWFNKVLIKAMKKAYP